MVLLLLPTFHATSTVVLVALLWYPLQPPVDVLYTAVGCGVFIDLDILLAGDDLEHGHRDLVTHSMLPWLCLLSVAPVFPPAFWVAVPVLLHLTVDAMDGGLRPLYPLSKWRVRTVPASTAPNSYISRLADYYLHNRVCAAEVVSAVLATLLSWGWDSSPAMAVVHWCGLATLASVLLLTAVFRAAPSLASGAV